MTDQSQPKVRPRFHSVSLDALNFLLADVRGALRPYLNVFLVTQQHWRFLSQCRRPRRIIRWVPRQWVSPRDDATVAKARARGPAFARGAAMH